MTLWLILCDLNGRGPGSVPGQGTRLHMSKEFKVVIMNILNKLEKRMDEHNESSTKSLRILRTTKQVEELKYTGKNQQ